MPATGARHGGRVLQALVSAAAVRKIMNYFIFTVFFLIVVMIPVSASCGESFSLNNTYIESSDGDTSPCKYSICKASSDICQLRLGFTTFDIAQPATTVGKTNVISFYI